MTCINCDNEHDYKFCPNCGERADVPTITFTSILANSVFTLTSMDKGFLYNVKNLLLNPNKTVNEYIRGKRKNIFNPISFLILCVTSYLIASSFGTSGSLREGPKLIFYDVGYEAGKFLVRYSKFFWILSVVWLSISTRLIFKKYNFAEHLAINALVIGQSTLFGLVGYLFAKITLVLNPIVYLSILWLTFEVFRNKKKDWDAFLLSVLSTLFFIVQLIIILGAIGVIKYKYFH